MYGGSNKKFSEGQPYAKTIAEFILKRPLNLDAFKKVDEAIYKLAANFEFLPTLNATINTPPVSRSGGLLAYYIAAFCAANKLYFDVKKSSKYELEEITQHTTIGKALFDMECFTHQAEGSTGKARIIGMGHEKANAEPATATPAPKATPTAQPTAQPQQPAQPAAPTAQPQAGANGKKPPKNDYKGLGGLSDRVTGLVGKPHDKEILSGDLFCVACRDLNRQPTEDTAYIRPIDAKYVDKANNCSNLLYGKAKGYGYLTVYSPSLTIMSEIGKHMYDAIRNNPEYSKLKNNLSEVYVAKKHPSKDGYFKVRTNLGYEVYVSAAKLNEELAEDLELEENLTDSSISIPVDLFEKHLIK